MLSRGRILSFGSPRRFLSLELEMHLRHAVDGGHCCFMLRAQIFRRSFQGLRQVAHLNEIAFGR